MSAPSWVNVNDYGASGSVQSTTGTMSSSSTTLTLASAIDFANGQGIVVNEAGPNTAGGLSVPSPSAFSVGGTGTTYNYKVCALTLDGGQTAASSAASTSGPSTLNWKDSKYNYVTCAAISNAIGYAVYGRTSGNYQLLGLMDRPSASATTLTFLDYGQSAVTRPTSISATPPAAARRDHLRTTVSSGGGTTTLTLAAASSAAVSGVPVVHDDSAAFAAALAAMTSEAAVLYIPGGSYQLIQYLLVSGRDHLRILGEGQSATILIDNSTGQDESASPAHRFGIVSVVDSSDFELSHLTLQGQPGVSPVHYRKKGVFLRGDVTTPRNLVVHDITARDLGGEAIYADGSGQGVVFRNNYCLNCLSNAINVNASTTSGYTMDAEVLDNIVEGGLGHSAIQGGGRTLIVARNRIRVPDRTGGDVVQVTGVGALELVGNIISDCVMTATGVPAIRIGYNAGDTSAAGVVADNVILNNSMLAVAGALHLENVPGPLLVSGNIIAGNGSAGVTVAGIKVDGASTGRITIDGNYIAAGTNAASGITITSAAAGSGSYDVRVGENFFASNITTPNRLIYSWFPTNYSALVVQPTAAIPVTNGEVPRTIVSFTLPAAVWTASATTQDVVLATIPARTRIASVIADTTVAYLLGGVSVQLQVGITTGGTELLLAHSVTSTVTRGLVSGDLGGSLASPVQGGVLTSAMWTTATTNISARLTGGSNLGNGSVTNLSAGSTTFHFICEPMP
jgi:hypothetical protein